MARFPIGASEALADRVAEIVGARVPPRKATAIAKAVMAAVEEAVVAEGDAAIHGHGKFVARPGPIFPTTGEPCEDRTTIVYLPSRTAKDRMSRMMTSNKKKRRKR